ncbi:MAG: CDP-glycerol glycerophosphotransferase [Solirubrobacteraceae bacterium]|nr:CDP-glycerol glycerophosphotransferase [Solirubrobacteraceae bacterium]
MPRISVVVPIFNVERYLAACLESAAAQTVSDLEIVMVDDGSTDGSSAIAREFAAADVRFKLLTQPNGGLSKARNTGIDAASGEYLAFLDSDDVLPPNAYELLLAALGESGSDFASGNVHRLTSWGATSQSKFLAETFARTQLKTHVTRFRPLLADRTAWNKLFRRSFWDEHGFRFPEGVVHEDIPITLPAHFMARSVDVVADPVYLYRIREDGELSITQRRLEPRVLLDRLAAVQQVDDFLAERGPRRARRWYQASVVADDLRYHLNLLDRADPDYQELFLERVNAFLDRASDGVYDDLEAIERLKWHLVRRRKLPELAEVLRFEREDLLTTPPVRIGRRWYGDYPFRTDGELAIPKSVYRLDRELELRATLEDMRLEDGRLVVRGFGFISGIGAPDRDTQTLTITALRSGRLRRVRARVAAVRFRTRAVRRPDATAKANQPLSDATWSGFEASLDPRRLGVAGRWPEGNWELNAHVRAGSVHRRTRLTVDVPGSIQGIDLPARESVTVAAGVTWWGRPVVEVRHRWLRIERHALDGDALVLSGAARLPSKAGPKLELARQDGRTMTLPLERDGERFSARIPLERLRKIDRERPADPDENVWNLTVALGAERLPIALPEANVASVWRRGSHEIALVRGRLGRAAVSERHARSLLTDARWSADGTLEVAGELAPDVPLRELVFYDEDRNEGHAFAVERDPESGRFTAALTPARIDTLAGPLSLAPGIWRLNGRGDPQGPMAPAILAPSIGELRTTVDHKPYHLTAGRDARALLSVLRALDDDERGRYHQSRLAASAYAARRDRPLRDAVVYLSYGGRQYSDSPRAIHEELLRRDAPVEHLWVVRDGLCRPPEGTTVLREGSREYHEALADARYVIANDHFPTWFARRDGQTCVQTWHGTPLKRLGLDVSTTRKTVRRFQYRWEQQVANWQYVVSPNRFSTPILRRAYAIEGEMLETGYPRTDFLTRPGRDEAARALRRRLGIPDGVRTILYAPTYRDSVRDQRGRYRMDQRLDIDRLRAAVGGDTVILYRKHHYVADAVPTTPDGFVRDVSSYPDGTELMLAADVLVTDYSSMMVDFANTGRPMLFYTYDFDAYEDEIRGFYLDFAETVPGPLLRTTDALGEALQAMGDVERRYADRYAAFQERFCELDDGQASSRLVDRVLS